MWSIQVKWGDVWVTVQRGFASRSDAEWATAKWKMANNCTGDPFRAYQEPKLVAAENLTQEDQDFLDSHDHDQRAEDEAVYQAELRSQLANRV